MLTHVTKCSFRTVTTYKKHWTDEDLTSSKPLLSLNLAKLASPERVTLTECRTVGSYNWRGTPAAPCIVVPGAPRVYKLWNHGRLRADAKLAEIPPADANNFMLPSFPTEPMFRAIELCYQSLGEAADFQKYDMATSRNSLRKLFAYCNSSSRYLYRPKRFRIDVQRVGDLIVLMRNDPRNIDVLHKEIVAHRTFGFDFESRSAIPIHPLASGSHRRIVEYNLGGLRFLVSFEVDCAELHHESLAIKKTGLETERLETETAERDATYFEESGLMLIKWGRLSTDNVVELATRYANIPDNEAIKPQLYFSSISTLIVCKHINGLCVDVVRRKFNAATFEANFSSELRRFCNLLQTLLDFVRDTNERRTFTLIYDREVSDDLHLYETVNVKSNVASEKLKDVIRNKVSSR